MPYKIKKKYLITGAAGFIGYHLCKRLIKKGYEVLGIDNLNSYYDINLKKSRLVELNKLTENNKGRWKFLKGELGDKEFLSELINNYLPDIVINLAAQAGVRYSIENPNQYIQSNIVGFSNLLEIIKDFKVEHLIYASSSSVYGGNKKIPFSEKDPVDNPVSIYAATKKANELIAHSYSHLYKLPTTGVRFFTVYGPWGRPDMAPMIFSKAILNNQPIRIFNKGDMWRDFTYIDDVIESLERLIDKPPTKNLEAHFRYAINEKCTPYRIVNIGNGNPIKLIKFIRILENELGIKAKKVLEEMQLGDVKKTFADTSLIESLINYKPRTDLKAGIKSFVNWYKSYYEI